MPVKRIADIAVRLLGLKRPKPATRFQIYVRRCEYLIAVVGLAYLALLVYPQALFAYSVTSGNITLHSREPLPPAAIGIVAQAAAKVSASELAEPGRHEDVYICNSPGLYRLFAPTAATAFANTMPVTDNIFVANADLSNDISRSSALDHNIRSVSGVVAHEITHNLVEHRLGLYRALRLPDWIAEGYPDYVAHESSFPESVGLRLVATRGRDPSPSFDYFLYRQMVRHLIEDKHLSFAQVAARADDFSRVERETIMAMQPRTETGAGVQ
jgi:hypothetical protein